jgi:hypothetical protein
MTTAALRTPEAVRANARMLRFLAASGATRPGSATGGTPQLCCAVLVCGIRLYRHSPDNDRAGEQVAYPLPVARQKHHKG